MRPDYSYELTQTGAVAGVDEAGRGPWAGPVVAAAVILQPDNIPAGIHDSKKLSKRRRELLFPQIMASARSVGVGICSAEEIDRYNILEATKLAMQRAYDAMGMVPDLVLVDGNQLPALPCAMRALVGGDALSLSIAAASIIAKVTRDRMMEALAVDFPEYGWDRNAGYGTRVHQEALLRYGVTAHHRRSFAPIRALVEKVA